jgi:IS5 family transposase
MREVTMSLDVDGFSEIVSGGVDSIVVAPGHRLIKLAQSLPWEEMLVLVLPDLQCTDKNTGGWVGLYGYEFIWEFIFSNRCLT